jgi:FlaG/FlaF family flagellin (archaellin)
MKWQWHDPQEKFTFFICGVILLIAIVKLLAAI